VILRVIQPVGWLAIQWQPAGGEEVSSRCGWRANGRWGGMCVFRNWVWWSY